MLEIMPSKADIERLHRKYAPNQQVYDLVYGHCQIVAEMALWCAENVTDTDIDKQLLETAALLHDVGSYAFFDDNGKGLNSRLYPQHAILGAKILTDEGIDERITSIIATHVLLGLTKKEIIDKPWPLPEHNYEPQNIEGELLCYADRFHSKKPCFNNFDTFLEGLKQDLPLQGEKFEQWSRRFGVPDIQAMSNKYNQPAR
jgi:uncharacterized protein